MSERAADKPTTAPEVRFVFDINRRVYHRDQTGRAVGGPIFRERYKPRYLIREDGRSWWVSSSPDGSFPEKVGKLKVSNWLTAEQVEDECWREAHRPRIARLVSDCRDPSILKKVAALLGYDEDVS